MQYIFREFIYRMLGELTEKKKTVRVNFIETSIRYGKKKDLERNLLNGKTVFNPFPQGSGKLCRRGVTART